MEVLSWILFGFVVGLVARALMPGPDSMGFVGTTVLGVFGALLGGWFSRLMGWSTATGFGTLLSAVIGSVAVLTAVNVYQKSKRRRRPAITEGEEKTKGGRAA
jgi:uncharacterized membrane protein YeaQ/YmgE (transglycosylase-associated protein family)